jgi:DNA-binding winged helix-turn-helix (wHTH) protein/predicted ATPase
MRYIFIDCVLDTQLHLLSRGGRYLRLRPKVFQVLTYLLAHRDRVVSKQELCDQVWAAQAVSDAVIENCIKAVRRAIGDDGRAQRLIETQYGYGYRFVASVTVSPEMHSGTACDDAPLAEQKIVTVLCCVSTRMPMRARHHPEVSYQRLLALDDIVRSEVERYGGMLQSTTGDRLVAIFGTPMAQEDHAQRAMLAALGIRQQLREQWHTFAAMSAEPLRVRMGLHTGRAAVIESGTSAAPGTALVGDTVAQAVALQERAAPGSIVCSEVTARLLRQAGRLVAVPPLPVTGQAASVHAYTLLGRAVRHGPVPLAVTPFVGRTHELAALHAAWTQIEAGQGHVVGIVGEPGMGKSRLVQEFRRSLRGGPHTYVRGRCMSYGQVTPYQSVLTLLRHACRITDADRPVAIAAKVHRRLCELGMEPAAAPYLLHLLGGETEPERLAGMSPEERKARTFAILLQMSLNACRDRPLVLEIEDLHWLDASSEDCLTWLAERLVSVPILLLLTYRPGYRSPWIDKSYTTQVALSRLTSHDSTQVVQALLPPRQRSEAVIQEIVAKAGGNPFFLEELAQTVLERGTAQPTLTLPDTIHAVLTTRIDRLPPLVKRVLQTGAVIGREVPYSLLEAITTLPRDNLGQSLAHLQAAELLHETRLVPESIYTFKHVLTQEAAYHSLLPSTRQQLHQQIAHVLEVRFPESTTTQPELLAHHYTEAGLSETAMAYWQRAGQRAVEHSAHVEAITHFRQGLELLYTLPVTPERDQRELALQRSLAVLLSIRYSATREVEDAYARAVELCRQVGNTQELFPVLYGLRRFYKKRGKLQRARELGEQLLTLAQGQHDPVLLLCGHYALGDTLLWLGAFQAARTQLECGMTYYDPQRSGRYIFPDGSAAPGPVCLGSLSWTLWYLGYPEQALQRSHAALTLAYELGHPVSLGIALTCAATLHMFRQEWQMLRERAEALWALAAKHGFAQQMASATRYRGIALFWQGQITEGIAQIQQGLAALQTMRTQEGRASQLAWLAQTYGHTGQPEEGLCLIDEAMAATHDTEERSAQAHRYRIKGELLLLQPRPDSTQAESCLQQALAIARQQHAKSLELQAALPLCRLWQQQGRRENARQLLAPLYGWFIEGFETPDLQEAKALLEELG